MKHVKAILLAMTALMLADPAVAVPPPPPLPSTLDAVQALITSLTKKDYAAYDNTLADDFMARKIESNEIMSREAWLREIKGAFENEILSVSIIHVYEGSATVGGKFRPQVMLVERVSNFGLRDGIPGDCCVYYLTETLTMDRGKITRIDRSTLFWNELSKTGERTDLR